MALVTFFLENSDKLRNWLRWNLQKHQSEKDKDRLDGDTLAIIDKVLENTNINSFQHKKIPKLKLL